MPVATFQPGDAVQKSTLHFFKFHFILRFFCKFHRLKTVSSSFRYFSSLTLDFLLHDMKVL